MAAPRDPITTHVLDSTTGRPAPSLPATLTLLSGIGEGSIFVGKTSSTNGRISQWEQQGSQSLEQIFSTLTTAEKPMVWSLRFETGSYWGKDKTFYPEVEVKFFVGHGEAHYHVPVLLGPWGYTTYRGN